jgi:hypothetical protein
LNLLADIYPIFVPCEVFVQVRSLTLSDPGAYLAFLTLNVHFARCSALFPHLAGELPACWKRTYFSLN